MAASLLDSLNSELATVRRIQKSCGGDVDEELANAQRRGDKFLMLKARLASELGKLAEVQQSSHTVGTCKRTQLTVRHPLPAALFPSWSEPRGAQPQCRHPQEEDQARQ